MDWSLHRAMITYLLIWSLQNVYACMFASDSLLKDAAELGIRKPLRHRYGGGITEFVYAERHRFSGIEQPKYFLTSQERQTIVRHTLFKLRSDGTDTIENFTFEFGQPISQYCMCARRQLGCNCNLKRRS